MASSKTDSTEKKIIACGYSFNFDENDKKLIRELLCKITKNDKYADIYIFNKVDSGVYYNYSCGGTEKLNHKSQYDMKCWFSSKKDSEKTCRLVSISFSMAPEFVAGEVIVEKDKFYVFFTKGTHSTSTTQIRAAITNRTYKSYPILETIEFKCKAYLHTA